MSKVFAVTLSVWATVNLEEDGAPEYTAKDVEKSVIAALRRIGFDTDVEVMDTAIADEDMRLLRNYRR